jgi:hypothetical protein
MLKPSPVSFHLDLYRYWLWKRGNRTMPARRDIDPADIPALLPHISMVHKVDGKYRFRLVGSAIVRQFGRDLTGNVVGSHVSNTRESIAALHAIGERIFESARPVFATGEHETILGAFHHVSTLLLPLSDDERHVNLIIFTRIACFDSDAKASRNWLAGAPFRMGEAVDIEDDADLVLRCLDWEQNCLNTQPAKRKAS